MEKTTIRATAAPAFRDEALQAEASHAIARAQRLLSDGMEGMVFDPEEHKYFLGTRELRSVSSIVEHFAPFDSLAMAKRCSANPRHEMYGKDPQDIVAIWKERGRMAADEGTRIHEFGEACYAMHTGGDASQIPEAIAARVADGILLPQCGKEEAAASWWNDLDMSRYVPVAKETRLVNVAAGYAGTMDLLLYDMQSHGYALRDYKTNADLYRWFGGYLIPPLSTIKDNDIGKYTVQQTLYMIQLENLGLPVTSIKLIWLKDDSTYEEVDIHSGYGDLVSYALTTL